MQTVFCMSHGSFWTRDILLENHSLVHGACAVTALFYCFSHSNPYFTWGLIKSIPCFFSLYFFTRYKGHTMIKFFFFLLKKAESNSTFFKKKNCTWYVFYRPKVNLFFSKWPSSRVLRDCRSILYLIVYSIYADCNNLIYGTNGMGGNWTLRTIPFHQVLQKCSETSCTFLLPF